MFHLLQPLDLQPGDRVEGTVEMVRQKDNPRLYEVGRQDWVATKDLFVSYMHILT